MWKSKDFASYNESDIREEFIRPLLHILGYSKNTINDIETEKSLELSVSFQRIGRKVVRIDYVPTIRLKAYWIIEAKAGTPKEMEIGDMLQAYLYATHPEIQASFIVLCNGWQLKIYDVHNYSDWENPVFTINNTDCDDSFDELRDILGADSFLRFQRDNLLQKIHESFETEIDEKELDSFIRNFNKEERNLRKTIKDNSRQLWREIHKEWDEEEAKKIVVLDNKTLINQMELYSDTYRAQQEYMNRIILSNPEERADLLRELSRVYYGRAKASFKCRYLSILFEIYNKKIEVAPSKWHTSVDMSIKDVIDKNLSYWEDNELENALCFLDRTCCRAAGVLVKNWAMEYGIKRAEQKLKTLPKENRLIQNISPAHEIVPYIFFVAEGMWYIFSSIQTSAEIRKQIVLLNELVDSVIEKEGIKNYPNNEHDLFQFERFGNDYDYLYGVTYNIIRNNIDAAKRAGVKIELLQNVIDGKGNLPQFNGIGIADSIDQRDRDIFSIRLMHAFYIGYSIYSSYIEDYN